jgi:putative endopeptidase
LSLVLLASERFSQWEFGPWGIDLTSIDTSIRPGWDFFEHVNGKYLERLAIPPDWSLWDNYVADLVLAQRTELDIIETEVRSDQPLMTEGGKIAALYRSVMREDLVENRGLSSLLPALSSISSAAGPSDIMRLMSQANLSLYDSISVRTSANDQGAQLKALHAAD